MQPHDGSGNDSGDGRPSPYGPQYGQPSQYGPQYGQPSQYGPQYGQPQYGQPPYDPQYGEPGVGPDPVAEPKRRRTAGAVAAGVVVLLGIGVGVFFLTRDDNSATGAASPKAGAEQLASLVAKQDVDGVLSLVDPAESRSLRPIVDRFRAIGTNSGAVAATGVPLPFISLSVDKVATTTDQANDTLAFVTVTDATGKAVTDYDKVPAGLRGNKTGTETDTGDLGSGLRRVRLGFVKVGAGWYFSPTTTALDAARTAARLAMPSFTGTPAAGGADSPEAAVRGLVTTAARGDVTAAAGYLSSNELPALRYYAAVFAKRLNPGQGRPNIEVTGLDLSTSDLSNGLKKVAVKAVTIKAPTGDTVTYRDGCIEGRGGRRCFTDSGSPAVLQQLAKTPPSVVTEQSDGKWQVAPLATLVETGRVQATDTASQYEFFRNSRAYALAPITGELKVGTASTVKLNSAGFAHTRLTGKAGQCVDTVTGNGLELRPIGERVEGDSCEGLLLPRTGVTDVALLDSERRAQTVTVTVEAK